MHRILAVQFRINRNINLLSQNFQLFDSCRTIYVTSYQQRLTVFLRLEHTSQLTREGSLTRTLQTRHQNNSRTILQFHLSSLTSHQGSELIVNDFHHQLARLHSSKYILAHSLFLHGVCKVFGYFIVYVRIQQCTANIFQCFGNINFGNLAFTFQNFKRPLQSFT